jgi:hypothetical protein
MNFKNISFKKTMFWGDGTFDEGPFGLKINFFIPFNIPVIKILHSLDHVGFKNNSAKRLF